MRTFASSSAVAVDATQRMELVRTSDGWIKIICGNWLPSEQWPRLEKQTTVNPRVEGPLAERSAEHRTSCRVWKELWRLWARGSEDSERALAKAKEVAWERPLEVQIKECREFISRAEHRVAKLEADLVAETTMLKEGRARLSRLEQTMAPPPPPPSRVAELEQQINALVQERDAFRAAATPTRKRGPVTPRPPQSSQEAFDVLKSRVSKRRAGRLVEEDAVPEDVQGLTEWLSDRQCDLRDAVEFGDLPSVGHLSQLIAEGAGKLQELERLSHDTSMVANMVP